MLPQALLDGYHTFLDNHFAQERSRYQRLAVLGQKPETMVISCCDSRVAPESIFDASPGELFVLRNVANLVPPYQPDNEYHGTSAALEFAVDVLHVKHIIVLGHGRCGGISAFLQQHAVHKHTGPFIDKWMNLIAPAAAALEGDPSAPDYLYRLELAAVRLSLDNLLTFPDIRERVEQGLLTLHGAFFDIATGELLFHNPETGEFSPAP